MNMKEKNKIPEPKQDLQYKLQGFIYRATVYATILLPFRWRGALVGRILQAVFMASPGYRRRIWNSLSRVSPAFSTNEKKKIQRLVPLNFGRTFIEIMFSHDLFRQSPNYFVSGPGFEALKEAKAQGRGAIIVMAHIGQWESVRICLREAGMECGGFYRTQKKQTFDTDFLEVLQHYGEPVFTRGFQGTRDMVRHLRRGGFLAIMADQNIQDAPIFDFFGLPAHTVTTAADLALKYDLLIVPAFGIRRRNNAEVDAIFEEPVPHSTPEEMTQIINNRFEERIRAHPEQWYWWYKRWNLD